MENVLIATTSTEGFKPLGSAPQRSYELIVTSLPDAESRLLFSEPVSSQYGDKVDWYTERSGRAKVLASLDEETQARVRERLGVLVDRVRAEAARLREGDEPDNDNERLAEALSNALEIPNEDSIYAMIGADGSADPVLVNWAWVEDRQNVVRGVLSSADTRRTAADARAAPPVAVAATDPETAAPEDARPAAAGTVRGAPSALWWWLFGFGWLILALLIAAILLLLIAPCALRVPGLPGFCVTGEDRTRDGERYTLVLRDRISILEREISMKDRACQPAPPRPDFLPPRSVVVPRPVAPPPVAEVQQIDDRLERAGAQVGDLTFSLIWDGPDDLDLEVTCPSGERLFWGMREQCNGRIDIDTGVGAPAPEPVENILFDAPVPGTYTVRVTMPTSRSGGAARPFQLMIREGDQVEILEGVVSGRDIEWGHSHQFGGN